MSIILKSLYTTVSQHGQCCCYTTRESVHLRPRVRTDVVTLIRVMDPSGSE